jgi:hypothetical protein
MPKFRTEDIRPRAPVNREAGTECREPKKKKKKKKKNCHLIAPANVGLGLKRYSVEQHVVPSKRESTLQAPTKWGDFF